MRVLFKGDLVQGKLKWGLNKNKASKYYKYAYFYYFYICYFKLIIYTQAKQKKLL